MVKVTLIDLVRLQLKKEELVYTLPDKLEVKIGRDNSNDIVIGTKETKDSIDAVEKKGATEDYISTVSRYHCVICNNHGVISIEDKGSRNGTYVNEISIYPGKMIKLNNEDVVRLGYYQLQVKIEKD